MITTSLLASTRALAQGVSPTATKAQPAAVKSRLSEPDSLITTLPPTVTNQNLKARLAPILVLMDETGQAKEAAALRQMPLRVGNPVSMGSVLVTTDQGAMTLNPKLFERRANGAIATVLAQGLQDRLHGVVRETPAVAPSLPPGPHPQPPVPANPFGNGKRGIWKIL